MSKIAYIVAENKRRNEINEELLRRFYTNQEIITIRAADKLPADAYLDETLPYTRTGSNYIVFLHLFIEIGKILFKGGLPTVLKLKKLIPIMITVNSTIKRYKENGKCSMQYTSGNHYFRNS